MLDGTPAPEPWASNIKHLVDANLELAGQVMWLKRRVNELEAELQWAIQLADAEVH